ncbi:MAG: hypothetical protein KGS61_10290, partial [Verrucomicrobia bacterium]|nr:hypothetical protein [Verrucomicrobiota bacterium]
MKKPIVLLIGAALLAAVLPASASVSEQTLDNLNTAFQGESNAAHRYEAFAKKADAEGYAHAARLFRAAARAEAIHKENHKQAILALGAMPLRNSYCLSCLMPICNRMILCHFGLVPWDALSHYPGDAK